MCSAPCRRALLVVDVATRDYLHGIGVALFCQYITYEQRRECQNNCIDDCDLPTIMAGMGKPSPSSRRGGRPPVGPMLSFRAPADDQAAWQQAADVSEVTLSAWMRRALNAQARRDLARAAKRRVR